jgi:hypothetical protein
MAPDITERLRASLARLPQAPRILGNEEQIATIRLAIVAKLFHPTVCEVQDWLGNLEVTAPLPAFPSELRFRPMCFSYQQWNLVNETAFQLYRYLRFGTNLDESRPQIDRFALLLLTISEARKLWTKES